MKIIFNVYSIGEKINPKNWNKEAKYPIESQHQNNKILEKSLL